MVEETLRGPRIESKLYRIFEEKLPRSNRLMPPEWEEDIFRIFYEKTAPHMQGVRNAEMAGFMIKVALNAIVTEAAISRGSWLENDTFRCELVTLLQRFIDRSQ
jgi:hypothetical protein